MHKCPILKGAVSIAGQLQAKPEAVKQERSETK
jgi:hypothetical protein